MNSAAIPLLAVDGGGTKCLAVFADAEGRMLASGRAGSCNYQGVGREAAALELTRAIREAKRQLTAEGNGGMTASSFGVSPTEQTPAAEEDGPLQVACAVFGLAGLDTAYDRRIIEELVHEALASTQVQADRVAVENDGVAALLGASGGDPGILIIAGTGSIVYGINAKGARARAGGWGHRVGDEGSGYWIGKQAIRAALRGYDGRGVATSLTDKLLQHLNLQNEEELFNWVYSAAYSVDKTAELSRLVGEAAQEGDVPARRILESAADELFLGAQAVVQKLGLSEADGPFVVIMQGGVLQYNPVVRSRLAERIAAFSSLARVDEAKREPIYGVIGQGRRLLDFLD
ncbi:N-acetylmuramic acid/N-acetylglucosamine kinase [Paenibacillus sp. J23TS9]|uniref:N-acetylglucosamine kinase n=1 Tax=Paenibacillus sp. J23TS9 TaxID=2807193 RepID=UPI001B0071D7|nr:BadF/BadG/BcrA/BcrD ATPase family protein [Paenibacillus sp. J23TS9]GIP30288.1 N-acetylmuramic acid/N-acetylglucosamine kinase [Paenibacillus sp. J23TS9]